MPLKIPGQPEAAWMWESEFKRNGWEVIALHRYAAGELEEKPLAPMGRHGAQFYKTCVSPVYNL